MLVRKLVSYGRLTLASTPIAPTIADVLASRLDFFAKVILVLHRLFKKFYKNDVIRNFLNILNEQPGVHLSILGKLFIIMVFTLLFGIYFSIKLYYIGNYPSL